MEEIIKYVNFLERDGYLFAFREHDNASAAEKLLSRFLLLPVAVVTERRHSSLASTVTFGDVIPSSAGSPPTFTRFSLKIAHLPSRIIISDPSVKMLTFTSGHGPLDLVHTAKTFSGRAPVITTSFLGRPRDRAGDPSDVSSH